MFMLNQYLKENLPKLAMHYMQGSARGGMDIVISLIK